MSSHVHIEDLGEKIELAIRSGKTAIKNNHQLLSGLDVTKDWYSRLKAGNRQLTEERFERLCELFKIEQPRWYAPLLEFGVGFGFTRYEVFQITRKYLPGIDFGSRIKDRALVDDVFHHIKGYWESFYFSASKLDKKVVSRDFFFVKGVNADGFIECEIIDSNVTYVGWCFPMKSHLYFILEKDRIFNEIIVYCTNLPDRFPPRLYGIILCLSGGVDEIRTSPAGAKCAFRHIGDSDAVRRRFNLGRSADARGHLIELNKTSYYIDPEDPALDSDTKQILNDINNVLSPTAVPAVLRMVK